MSQNFNLPDDFTMFDTVFDTMFDTMFDTEFDTKFDTMLDTSVLAEPSPKRRKPKAPAIRDEDWKPHREKISSLYESGMTLNELRYVMLVEDKFSAEYAAVLSRYMTNALRRRTESVNTKGRSKSGDWGRM